jgi:autotransporter-associated beta strand protein
MSPTRPLLPALLLLAAANAPVSAALPVVVSSTSNLLPNSPNQLVQFFITGTDAIAAHSLSIQVNTGTSGPTLTSINPTNAEDPFAGTIFAGNNLGQLESGILTSGTYAHRLAIIATLTDHATVTDNGILVSLLVSTAPGDTSPFTINLLNTANGNSYFALPDLTTFSPLQPNTRFSIAPAADRQWIFNGGGTWNNDARWTPFAPYTVGDKANFLDALTGPAATITLDGNRTVGTLTFDNPTGSYTIAPGSGGTLTFNNGAPNADITVARGTHIISAPVALQAATTINVTGAATDSLTLAGPVSGASSTLAFTGPGKLILTGPATYIGATTVASGQLTFAGTAPHSVGALSGAGTVTVASGATLTSGNLSLASLEVDGTHILRPNGDSAGASKISDLSVAGVLGAWTGKLDITNNALILPAPDAAAQAAILDRTRDQIASGKTHNGTGPGITSSALLAANAYSLALVDVGDLPSLTSFRGISGLTADTTLVVMAHNGDATLDGVVDSFDLNRLAAHWQASNRVWSSGDFNNDGIVDAFDLNILAANWQFGTPGTSLSFEAALAQFPLFSATSPVPEPASLALLALAIPALLCRRRCSPSPMRRGSCLEPGMA